jgi:nicotinamide phosphoribosyltransferase
MNILLLTDSYKLCHHSLYEPGTEVIYSYFESRGGDFDKVVFFGLQYALKKYLAGRVVTKEMIDEAEEIVSAHLGNRNYFNRAGWVHILDKHDGRLPVLIKAAPEGSVVPTHNVLITIENTDPACFWLTNYLETLLVQTWYPCTVSTQSREMKKVILSYLNKTGDPGLIDFNLHDFGFRGVSSVETAAIGGAAHLVNFKGTDTLAGILLAREYYNEPMAGFSIPASEHSTITEWGRENEVGAMRNMLEKYPEGTIACVSDSYDIEKACTTYWGGILKDRVLARKGTLVVRPDSGSPPVIVCEVLDLLGKAFGAERNSKGYFVLNPHVRVIQGDGIDYAMISRILEAMEAKMWSADNIAFGSGGGLLQKLNRDTLKFAFKCSSARVNGKERDVYKEPITDRGKTSLRGRLKLVQDHGYQTRRLEQEGDDVLIPVFRDGEMLCDQSFREVRERAKV